jgi:hypothetical protein
MWEQQRWPFQGERQESWNDGVRIAFTGSLLELTIFSHIFEVQKSNQ